MLIENVLLYDRPLVQPWDAGPPMQDLADGEIVESDRYSRCRSDERNAHHTSDSVVTSYQNDGVTGTLVTDSLGTPLPAGYVYNRYASSTGRLGARRLHVEDWIAAIIFNHLIAGADAFVTAELWDLPHHVSAFRADDGRTVIAATISFR